MPKHSEILSRKPLKKSSIACYQVVSNCNNSKQLGHNISALHSRHAQADRRTVTLIQSGSTWQFKTESDLEEVVWRSLPELLNLEPVSRQFSINGKFCDILATGPSGRLVIIELKNTEDHYVVQQLTRYYHAIKTADTLPFPVDTDHPRLLAIAPSFHTDTLIDCQYSTLNVELITFSLEAAADNINLVLRDADGMVLSTLHLPKALQNAQPQISISEPPRKLLNWLSAVREPDYTWILELRKRLLNADARMRERVEANSIFYEKNKSKPCCELRKIKPSEYRGKGIDCYLWLPDPENNPHVIKMWIGIDLEKQKVPVMHYGRKGYKSGSPWQFPDCIERMQWLGYKRALVQYQPFICADKTVSPDGIVNLAIQTWHSRL